MELMDTVDLMNSADYKERFKAEYLQTKIRYNNLHKMLINILDGENALSKRNTRRVNIPYNDSASYFWNKADKNSPDYIDARKQYSEWLKEQRSW